MTSLQHFFHQAANRPLAFDESQIRSLIAKHDGAPGHHRSPGSLTRALRVVGVGLLLAGITTAVVDDSDRGTVAEKSVAPSSSPRVQARSKQAIPDATGFSMTAPQPRPPQTSLQAAASTATSMSGRASGVAHASHAATSHAAASLGAASNGAASAPASAEAFGPRDLAGTGALDIDPADFMALGLRRLADGRTAYAYYPIANIPASLAPNMKLDEAMLRANGYQDSLLVQAIGRNGRSDLFVSRLDLPLSVVTRKASPVASAWQVITDESGRLLEERVSVADGDQLRYVTELFQRGSDVEIARTLESLRGMDAVGRSLRLNTLLPIRVSLGEDSGHGVFWCRPDAQLIAQLPARSVAQLRRELETAAAAVGTRDTVAIVRRGWALSVLETIDSINPEQLKTDSDIELVPQAMTGAELFAGSRHKAGAIIRFDPLSNPSHGTAEFSLGLGEPRRVTVTLHDVNGHRVRTLVTNAAYDEGDVAISASLAGVERGLYLVAITTDRREQVVHRLVVE
jgi:hypothetical protein